MMTAAAVVLVVVAAAATSAAAVVVVVLVYKLKIKYKNKKQNYIFRRSLQTTQPST